MLDDVRFRCFTLAGIGTVTGAVDGIVVVAGTLFSMPYVSPPPPPPDVVDCSEAAVPPALDNSAAAASQVVRRPVGAAAGERALAGEKGAAASGSKSAEAGVTGPPEV